LRGKVVIEAETIKFGMIRLGHFSTPQYPNSGIRWDNHGTIVFKGSAGIGANSTISVSNKPSYIEFGDKFTNTTSLHLDCNYRIIFKERVLIGWNVTIMDSDMHRIKLVTGEFHSRGYDEVVIGADNWICTNAMILKGSKTPDRSIIGAGAILNKDFSSFPKYSLFSGAPAKAIKTNFAWRDINDNIIDYDFNK
jgi:acetyltransferase-like isoleucine patch superfamily enzyme